MRSLLYAVPACLAASPAAATDFDLMVGLRSTIASYIRDGGYACAEVTAIDPAGYEGSAGVMRVTCTSHTVGPANSRAFRVTAYPEGDFIAMPWADRP